MGWKITSVSMVFRVPQTIQPLMVSRKSLLVSVTVMEMKFRRCLLVGSVNTQLRSFVQRIEPGTLIPSARTEESVGIIMSMPTLNTMDVAAQMDMKANIANSPREH
jgi:hypothetical protein